MIYFVIHSLLLGALFGGASGYAFGRLFLYGRAWETFRYAATIPPTLVGAVISFEGTMHDGIAPEVWTDCGGSDACFLYAALNPTAYVYSLYVPALVLLVAMSLAIVILFTDR